MKAVGLVCLAYLASALAETTMPIWSCDDLQSAAAATSSDRIVGELYSNEISCDAWTTFEIAANRLKLVPTTDPTYVMSDTYVFSNVRFVLTGGDLRVEPGVEFTGTGETQEVNGGVLNVGEGSVARFVSPVFMHDVEVQSVVIPPSDFTSDQWFGGCIYNNGKVRFEDSFEADNCSTDAGGEASPGDGSGIWNGPTAKLVVKGAVSMSNCGTRDINGNRGGAIYNEGTLNIYEDADFTDNISSSGGAIYNSGTLKLLGSTTLATFTGNRSSDLPGGAVRNLASGVMKFNGGAVFDDNFTESSGGAIANQGELTIKVSSSFTNNVSNGSGGAIFNLATSDLLLPEDTIFEGNSISSPDFSSCDDIYSYTEDDFECLP